MFTVELYMSRGSKWRKPTVTTGKDIWRKGEWDKYLVWSACLHWLYFSALIHYCSWSLYSMFDSWFLLWLTQYYCIILDVDLCIASCHQLIRWISYDLWHMMIIALHWFYQSLVGIFSDYNVIDTSRLIIIALYCSCRFHTWHCLCFQWGKVLCCMY